MAKITKNLNSFDEQNTNDAKGKKVALIKTVEGMTGITPEEYAEGSRVINETSANRRERLRRQRQFDKDVMGRGFL